MTAEAKFVEKAHPHSWLLVADNLHGQAVALHALRGRSRTTRIGPDGEVQGQWDATNRAVFLLGGFALENCIKGFLIFENPHWISNGRLSKEVRSHSLTGLASKSKLLPNTLQGMSVLQSFEHGLESWARYPCGLSSDDIAEEGILSDELWSGYLQLMSEYRRRLQKLLTQVWHGPHGVSGWFKFSGEFFANSEIVPSAQQGAAADGYAAAEHLVRCRVRGRCE